MKIAVHKMKNGVTVIAIPKKGAYTTTVLVGVRVGSNHEKENELGLAHFFEHMCFKGTLGYPTAQLLAYEFDNLGISINAATSDIYTEYHLTGTKGQTKKLIDLASDIFLNPVLPKEELEKERGVILQEYVMGEDSPEYKAFRLCMESIFDGVPSTRPTIGTKKSILSLTHKQFLSFRSSKYVGSNTIVVVAGDFNKKEVCKHIEKNFSILKKGKCAVTPKTQPKTGKMVKIYSKKSDQAVAVIGFPSFGNEKEGLVLFLIGVLLSYGFSSRLVKRIREEMGACYYISSGGDINKNYGAFYISTGISPRNLKKVFLAINEELEKICNEEITKKELTKIINQIVALKYRGHENTHYLAKKYFVDYVKYSKISTLEEYIQKIKKVTPKDIKKVAKKYLDSSLIKVAIVGNIKESTLEIKSFFKNIK